MHRNCDRGFNKVEMSGLFSGYSVWGSKNERRDRNVRKKNDVGWDVRCILIYTGRPILFLENRKQRFWIIQDAVVDHLQVHNTICLLFPPRQPAVLGNRGGPEKLTRRGRFGN